MKKFKRICLILISVLFVYGCTNVKEYQEDEEITLSGTIENETITIDGTTKNISVLSLEEPITIDGQEINKVEIDYDKDLKEDTVISITGKLSKNTFNDTSLTYSFDVSSIDDMFAYINTFSNDDFSMTIPAGIMPIVTIEEIENGFILKESTSSSEIFRVVSLSKSEFNEMNNNGTSSIEKVRSDTTKVITIIYSLDTDSTSNDNIGTIINELSNIKQGIKIK